MVLGDVLIKLSALCAIVAFIGALRWARGRTASERTFRWAYHGMTATLAAASVLLLAAILRHDFRLDYVVGYTSRDLPLLYLISAFWAGQQGTYLLWALLGALLGYVLFRRGAWEPAAVMAFWVPTVAFMHALMLDPNGNPFRLAATVPPDGRGLNPLLQDPWMASHPPAVFLGYVAMTVPAVLAFAALVKRREDVWVGPALRWSLMSFILLGAGIVLGGFWAYKVLGWGGYWGWDPVENASLIPWIVITALVHGLLVQKATGALPRTNLALALAGYATVFYATFLTRSGVLADFSVHSFPAGSIYRILLGIQLLIVAVSLFLFFRRWSIRSRDVALELSWPLALTVALVLFVVAAGMVLIGTSWPMISSAFGEPSSFGPGWYNKVSQPVFIPLLALLAVAPFLAWGARPWPIVARRVALVAGLAAAGTLVAAFAGAHGFIALALFFVSFAALSANALRLLEVARVRLLNSGAALAHLGFAAMLLGIVGSSFWGVRQEARLPLGRPVEVMGRHYTFLGHVAGSEPQDRWGLRIERPGGRTIDAEVAMYRTGSARESQVLHKPAILRGLAGDLYVAPGGIETPSAHEELALDRDQPTQLGQATLTFRQFETHTMGEGAMSVSAVVEVASPAGREMLRLPLTFNAGAFESTPVSPAVDAGIASLELKRMSVEQQRIFVHADTAGSAAGQTLTVEISTKPMIGLLWAGTILLGVGCGVAWTRRRADERLVARAAVESEARARPPKGAERRAAARPARPREA